MSDSSNSTLTIQETQTLSSHISAIASDLVELPFPELVDLELKNMTEDQLKEYIMLMREEVKNPAASRSRVKRESDTIKGIRNPKKLAFNIDDLL